MDTVRRYTRLYDPSYQKYIFFPREDGDYISGEGQMIYDPIKEVTSELLCSTQRCVRVGQ